MPRRFVSRPVRPSTRTTAIGTGVAAVGLVLIVLAVAGVFSGSSSTTGTVKLAAATTTPPATPDAATDPFGAPSNKPDYSVPPPPGEPTLVPTIGTKTTQRLYGADPYQEAVSITQHIWPAALAENAPGGNDNVPDRPRAVTLLTTDDPLAAITATPLVHFPDDAPVLYVKKNGIPQVTANEIKRLGPTGIARYHNVTAFVVGGAANSGVENQLKAMGIKYTAVTAPNTPALANTVDKLYGSIDNPDTGVPTMDNGAQNVVIGSTEGKSYQYLLPVTHWVTHMETGLFWTTKNSVPQATIDALKRRNGKARIYLFGGPQQISSKVASQLSKYGTVQRVTNDDNVAFNNDPADSPVDMSIVFAKMWDTAGEMGWKITGPGHGFTLVNQDDWQGAVASSPLSHLGFHAPLLMTDNAGNLPPQVLAYYKSVAPTFVNTPADGPYNMSYVVGSWKQVSWPQQASVDSASEMANRRLWAQSTGGSYADTQPTG
jgi:hypothetical protein